MVLNIFLMGIGMMILSACSSRGEKVKASSDENPVAVQQQASGIATNDSVSKDTLNVAQVDKPAASQAATIDSLDLPPYATATLVNAIEYFRTNNKYKDWDPKNPQGVSISTIVETDGTLTDLTIVRKCNEELLNKEALRLIKEAKIEPAKNSSGDNIRSRWSIRVVFPPK